MHGLSQTPRGPSRGRAHSPPSDLHSPAEGQDSQPTARGSASYLDFSFCPCTSSNF